ncbi:MAG: hypothetical protein IPJ04_01355 [Candidatus Eisenbacteria bacterium]|nr:hypothetical protein [Candidatus Eisenbacteria bacterium]
MNFPVVPGRHRLRLYFAETYSGITAAGQRVFDVEVEGETVLSNFDVFAQVGANRAWCGRSTSTFPTPS